MNLFFRLAPLLVTLNAGATIIIEVPSPMVANEIKTFLKDDFQIPERLIKTVITAKCDSANLNTAMHLCIENKKMRVLNMNKALLTRAYRVFRNETK